MQPSMYLFFVVMFAILAICVPLPVEATHLSTKNSHARRSLTGKPVPREDLRGRAILNPRLLG